MVFRMVARYLEAFSVQEEQVRIVPISHVQLKYDPKDLVGEREILAISELSPHIFLNN